MAKFTVSIKCCCIINNLLLNILFNVTAEFLKCSLFLKNLEKHFCDLTYKKKYFVKRNENLPQHRKNLSEINYRLLIRFRKLRFIDYRNRPEHF